MRLRPGLGMNSADAEAVIRDSGAWIIHRPAHADLRKAAQVERRNKLGWRDALTPISAIEPGRAVVWTEDFSDGQRLGPITVRNRSGGRPERPDRANRARQAQPCSTRAWPASRISTAPAGRRERLLTTQRRRFHRRRQK